MSNKSSRDSLPAWDLKDFYQDIHDPEIQVDLNEYKNGMEKFAADYKGRVGSLTAEEFYQAVRKIEDLSVKASRLGEFAYLNMVTQMKNAEAMGFYQNISEKLTDYSKPAIFFSLEINALPDAKIAEWLRNDKVVFYKPWLERPGALKIMNCRRKLRRFCTKNP